MDTLATTPAEAYASGTVDREANTSAVSWPAIIAGTVVAAATSLILLAFGSGMALATVLGTVLLASAVSSAIGTGIRVADSVTSGGVNAAVSAVNPYDGDLQ